MGFAGSVVDWAIPLRDWRCYNGQRRRLFGPLWGTGFMRAGALSRGKESISLADLGAMLRTSMAGIQGRGGASLGDKTILDALDPIAATVEQRAHDAGSSL